MSAMTPIEAPPPGVPPEIPPTPPGQPGDTPQGPKRGLLWAWIGGGAALIVALLAVMVFVSRDASLLRTQALPGAPYGSPYGSTPPPPYGPYGSASSPSALPSPSPSASPSSSPSSAPPVADLRVDNVYFIDAANPKSSSPSVTPTAGKPVRIFAIVKNYGSKPAPQSSSLLQVDVNNDSPNNPEVKDDVATPALAAGERRGVYSSVTWTVVTGTHLLSASADVPRNDVSELGYEGNNFLRKTFTVAGQVNNAACAAPIAIAAGPNVHTDGSVKKGKAFTATVQMKNTGTKPWTIDPGPPDTTHRLGSQNPPDNQRWGLGRVTIPKSPINPNETATFTFTAMAPATAGTYAFDWKMVEEFVQWFGTACTKSVVVK
jgi:Ig-like domain-containing protein/CARDB protein